MASWEPTLIESHAGPGENPIENIDHGAKVIEIKPDAKIEPPILRSIENLVGHWLQGRAAFLGSLQAANPRHSTSFLTIPFV